MQALELTGIVDDKGFLTLRQYFPLDIKNKDVKIIVLFPSNNLELIEKRKSDLLSCFGALETKESADELIQVIYSSRTFKERNISL